MIKFLIPNFRTEKPVVKRVFLCILVAFLMIGINPVKSIAQDYDLILKGGHVIDPKNNIDGVMDVAIADGKIAEVSNNINENEAEKVMNVEGLYVTPGLIDLHGHIFWGNEPSSGYSNGHSAVKPDAFTFRSGVTTIVDAGGPGWRNFTTFKDQVIDHSRTRVLAFLNIVGRGMKGGEIEQNLDDMDPEITGRVAKKHEEIVGIKLAHFSGRDWTPTRRAVEAGEIADIPVMVDFGRADPPLSIEQLFMEELRPGDIYTHAFTNVSDRENIVDEETGKLQPFVKDAQERGIIMDVGHGGSSFKFAQAIPAFEQGVAPNTISTDLHRGSMNDEMKTQINVMSKILNIGMPFYEVVDASTWRAAQAIKREDLGHLSEGAVADIAVLDVIEGDFGFLDAFGYKMDGDQKLECELTLKDGEVVWNLNGIGHQYWD